MVTDWLLCARQYAPYTVQTMCAHEIERAVIIKEWNGQRRFREEAALDLDE